MKKIALRSTIYSGEDSLGYLDRLKGKRIFFVTDPFMKESGMIDSILERITDSNQVAVFCDIVPDPPIEVVSKGVAELMALEADRIIALGGGSAIDAAKAMKYFAFKGGQVTDIPLIAIPTTSGTGSEVTDFAVITNQQTGTKYPLVDSLMLPEIAILDTSLVLSVPPVITADTGVDVLTHVLEAKVSKNASTFSDAFAEKAFCLVFEYLERAYKNGSDYEAREKMHQASCMGGLAFNQASLGLNHGMAHAIGARLHVAHGRLNGILMPHLIAFNAQDPIAEHKYAELYRMIDSNASTNDKMAVKQLIKKIKKLLKELHIPQNLTEAGIKASDVLDLQIAIVEASIADACTETNPISPTKEQVTDLLKSII